MSQIIAMNDFRREDDRLRKSELAACERVIQSGWWILGSELKRFENSWATYLGVPEVIGCANGLDAIEIGLRALSIGVGDEVITTPMTAFATVLAIIRAGATPVLADVDHETAVISPESVRRCISSRTRAILLVHIYGQIAFVDEFQSIAQEFGLYLLEDCAQAHGAIWNGKAAGAIGTFGAWSFYPTKNLGAVGDAGSLSTSSPEVAENARTIRNYGQSTRYYHPVIGMNSRLDEIQAAILGERLKYLPDWTLRRQAIAESYHLGISNKHVQCLKKPREKRHHVYHLFVIRCVNRTDIQAWLKVKGVESLIHYPVPVHHQESCRNLKRDPFGLKCAESHAETCLSLPCHPYMSEDEVRKVIAAVNDFVC